MLWRPRMSENRRDSTGFGFFSLTPHRSNSTVAQLSAGRVRPCAILLSYLGSASPGVARAAHDEWRCANRGLRPLFDSRNQTDQFRRVEPAMTEMTGAEM